jgi:dephospho-CoA kinase
MPAIGITGGVSTGKSSFCRFVHELMPEARFFDADHVAHQLADRDPQVKKEIAAEFGADVYSNKGDLNRAALRAIIFKDAAKKRALEKILHPRIRRQWSAEAETHRKTHDFFFADIPLLYETGGETLCDRVVVVACSRPIQMARQLERVRGVGLPAMDDRQPSPPGYGVPGDADATGRKAAEAMISSQMPLEEKIARADHVVWNNAGEVLLRRQAELLVALWRRE